MFKAKNITPMSKNEVYILKYNEFYNEKHVIIYISFLILYELLTQSVSRLLVERINSVYNISKHTKDFTLLLYIHKILTIHV